MQVSDWLLGLGLKDAASRARLNRVFGRHLLTLLERRAESDISRVLKLQAEQIIIVRLELEAAVEGETDASAPDSKAIVPAAPSIDTALEHQQPASRQSEAPLNSSLPAGRSSAAAGASRSDALSDKKVPSALATTGSSPPIPGGGGGNTAGAATTAPGPPKGVGDKVRELSPDGVLAVAVDLVEKGKEGFSWAMGIGQAVGPVAKELGEKRTRILAPRGNAKVFRVPASTNPFF